MAEHLIDGEFQSDKYPTCPRGKVPLSCKDPTAQDLLWTYARRHRPVDGPFSDDLEEALLLAGYQPPSPTELNRIARELIDPVAPKLLASEWDRLFDGIVEALAGRVSIGRDNG